MLRELSIRAFALIDEVEVPFGPGMTCVAGETGAGKSILIDALSAALGSRMASDLIRPGARKAVVEASFDISGLPQITHFLKERDLDWEGPRLILRRELTASGTSRCFINDTPSTTLVVRELALQLMDFHGQHDTYGLLDVRIHRSIVDSFAADSVDLPAMTAAWQALQSARGAYKELLGKATSAEEERARLDFVIREIEEVAPVAGEDVTITDELKRAESREQIITAAQAARESLYTGEMSAYEQLTAARENLLQLLPFAPGISNLLAEVESAISACKEGSAEIADLADVEDFSPERLEELRLRLGALQRLIKKYGSVEEAITVMKVRTAEREELLDINEALASKQAAVKTHEASAEKIAAAITRARTAAAGPLAEAIQQTLSGLGMPSAKVVISIRPADLGPHGSDAVEILFSANAGEEAKPLARIASGGELSRFMLALKKAQVADTSVGSMVFDEIDTGISGRIARRVGEELQALSLKHQVICITHLPQIASLAAAMIRVEKTEAEGKATITAKPIGPEEMVEEVARLMSGSEISEAALKGASELMAPLNNVSE